MIKGSVTQSKRTRIESRAAIISNIGQMRSLCVALVRSAVCMNTWLLLAMDVCVRIVSRVNCSVAECFPEKLRRYMVK